jgi:hypothetical protein
MSLSSKIKIASPIFDTNIISYKEPIRFRPFLVKEEKVLLIAKESGERKKIIEAIKNIISNCVENEDFEIDKIALFEMEYLFLKIRAVSVDNIVNVNVIDSDDEKTYTLLVNLDEVKLPNDDLPEEKFTLVEDIGVKMRFPRADITESLSDVKTMTDLNYQIVKNSIEYIYNSDDMMQWSELNDKEKDEFLDNLDVKSYEKMIKFLDNVPTLKHEIFYENENKEQKKVVFRNLDDFFILA